MGKGDRAATSSSCLQFRRTRISRRATLRAGAIGLAGLGLPGLLRARSGARTGPAGFGRAKSCILIFMWGGPSQLDTWDPKPGAPEDIRGPFRPIATSVPGISISEHFPLLAQQAHRLSIVRSMNHDDAAHLSTAHRLLTGHLAPTPNSDAAGPSPRDWPHLGALVSKLRPTAGAIPSAVNMPWTVMHPAAPGGRAPGQDAGWLGKAYDPFHVDGDPNALGLPRRGPRSARRDLAGTPGFSPRAARAARRHCRPVGHVDRNRGTATSRKRSTAWSRPRRAGRLQIDREDPKLRDRYGRNIHGQCLLLARRLIEAGVGLVTVNWHNDGQNFWDTHGDNFNQLKNRLMPPADQGFSALLDDLDCSRPARRDAGRLGRRVRPHAADHQGQQRPRALAALLLGRPGRSRRARRLRLRRVRPLGRLPGQRSGQPRRPGRDHSSRPGHRPRHAR